MISVAAAPAISSVHSPAPRQAVVWFVPLPNVGPWQGSVDYMRLFDRNARWQNAARHVRAFELLDTWVNNFASFAQLRRVVSFLNAHRIAIAIGSEALLPEGCGQDVEGFGARYQGADAAARIAAAGGRLAYVALDEPYYFGSVYNGPNACHWPAAKVAQEVDRYVRDTRAVSPKVHVGDIEPLHVLEGFGAAQLVRWLDLYRQVTGRPLPFFDLDPSYEYGWSEQALQVERAARARHIPFGMIYNGDGATDADWTASSEVRFSFYETQAGGHPDRAILDSWVWQPDDTLPETKPGTFTWLIDRYVRQRTTLALTATAGGVRGVLNNQRGKPLSNLSVELSGVPQSGPGIVADYTITGTVTRDQPYTGRNATKALVGFRVNTECNCSGPADFFLYHAAYTEEGDTTNRIPNPSFDDGPWANWGASIQLEPSDQGDMNMVHVNAAAGQATGMNSGEFPVTAGARFRVTVTARVSPMTAGSGYFTIIFLDAEGGLSRLMVPIAPAAEALATVITGSDGSFDTPLPAGRMLIHARFRGDTHRFPAYAATKIG